MVIEYKVMITMRIMAKDATYTAEFSEELTKSGKTGRVRVKFIPDMGTMKYPEDANRQTMYVMDAEKARALYAHLFDKISYWFALDTANYFSK